MTRKTEKQEKTRPSLSKSKKKKKRLQNDSYRTNTGRKMKRNTEVTLFTIKKKKRKLTKAEKKRTNRQKNTVDSTNSSTNCSELRFVS